MGFSFFILPASVLCFPYTNQYDALTKAEHHLPTCFDFYILLNCLPTDVGYLSKKKKQDLDAGDYVKRKIYSKRKQGGDV